MCTKIEKGKGSGAEPPYCKVLNLFSEKILVPRCPLKKEKESTYL